MPTLVRPEGEAPALEELKLPSKLSDLEGKELSEALQKYAAWKAYADQETGVATAFYILVSIEKRLDAKNPDLIRAAAFAQAYMKRLELYSKALETMYNGLSRQVAIRDQDTKIHGNRTR